MNRLIKILSVSMVVLIFLLLIQQSHHIHRDYEIQSRKKVLTNQQERNHHLQVMYDIENRLDDIQDYAEVTLNMTFPKTIRYLNE